MTLSGFPTRVHCVGVGGGGVSALAALFAREGHVVTGSDLVDGETAAELRAHGVAVRRGHDASHLDGAQLVVRSAAVRDDNPELAAARARDLPVLKHSQALGRLMQARRGVGIAGTHGKTTTTAMLAHLLAAAGRDPGWMVGGRPLCLPAAAAAGAPGAPFVAEACEFGDSFLDLPCRVGVVLSVAPDHLDWYGDEAGVRAGFQRFVARLPPGGTLVLGAGVPDDCELRPADGVETWRVPGRVRLSGLREDAGGWTGRLDAGSLGGGPFRLGLLGRHNLDNLSAALLAAAAVGAPIGELLPHVATFTGVGRRLQAVGAVSRGPGAGARVFDDFAHHPDEVAASAEAIRTRFPGRRLVGVFQPHQVSRTEDLLAGFARALGRFDLLLLCDIFVARDPHPERAEAVVADLVAAAADAPVRRVGPARAAADEVLAGLRPDDVCLVMGAGDIDGLARALAGAAAGG